MKYLPIIICALALCLGEAYAAEQTDADKKVPAVWAKNCAPCHGGNGQGTTTIGRKMKAADLTSEKIQKKYKDKQEEVIKLISEGLIKDKKIIMKPLKDKLEEEDMKELAKYLEELGKKKDEK